MNESFPLQIAFRDIAASPAIESRIRREARKLERFHQRITTCRVVVQAPERGHHRQRLYLVRINISAPHGNIWINRNPSLDLSHEDVYVAIRDAFNAAVRRLEDLVRRQAGQVKHHDAPPHGIVRSLLADKGYGFIETPGGDQIYFDRKSVINDAFDRLSIGSQVRFVLAPETVGKPPQASTVRIVGKHGIAEP